MHIVEGIFYTFPHQRVLLAEHAVMKAVWQKCAALIKEGAVMAPLLVDDRRQKGTITKQSIESLLTLTTGKNYASFPWLGPQISELQLEARHKTSDCARLAAEYQLSVMWYLQFLAKDWVWTKVYPEYFQESGAQMFQLLLERMGGEPEPERFLGHFRHFWVAEDGQVGSYTKPIWKSGMVVHEPIPHMVSTSILPDEHHTGEGPPECNC